MGRGSDFKERATTTRVGTMRGCDRGDLLTVWYLVFTRENFLAILVAIPVLTNITKKDCLEITVRIEIVSEVITISLVRDSTEDIGQTEDFVSVIRLVKITSGHFRDLPIDFAIFTTATKREGAELTVDGDYCGEACLCFLLCEVSILGVRDPTVTPNFVLGGGIFTLSPRAKLGISITGKEKVIGSTGSEPRSKETMTIAT